MVMDPSNPSFSSRLSGRRELPRGNSAAEKSFGIPAAGFTSHGRRRHAWRKITKGLPGADDPARTALASPLRPALEAHVSVSDRT